MMSVMLRFMVLLMALITLCTQAPAVAEEDESDQIMPQLYIGGNPVYPPYEIESDGKRVIVNGLQFYPPVTSTTPAHKIPPLSPQMERESRERAQVSKRAFGIWSTHYDHGNGLSAAAATTAVAESLLAVAVVSAVEIVSDSTAVLVSWTNFPAPTILSLGAVRRFQSADELPNVADTKASGLRRKIADGCIVFVDGGVEQVFLDAADSAKKAELAEAVRSAQSGSLQGGVLNKNIVSSLARPIPIDNLIVKEDSHDR